MKRLTSLCLFITLCWTLGASAFVSPPPTVIAERNFDRALRAQLRSDTEAASAYWNKAAEAYFEMERVSAWGEFPSQLEQAGIVFYATANESQATDVLKRALSDNPDLPYARAILGAQYVRNEDYAAANKTLAVPFDGKILNGMVAEARSALEQGDRKRAGELLFNGVLMQITIDRKKVEEERARNN